jgi:hypothetical protein
VKLSSTLFFVALAILLLQFPGHAYSQQRAAPADILDVCEPFPGFTSTADFTVKEDLISRAFQIKYAVNRLSAVDLALLFNKLLVVKYCDGVTELWRVFEPRGTIAVQPVSSTSGSPGSWYASSGNGTLYITGYWEHIDYYSNGVYQFTVSRFVITGMYFEMFDFSFAHFN